MQIRGTQMGSVCSGAKASLDFGGCEDDWLRRKEGREKARRTLGEYDLEPVCIAERYADDGLFTSEI